MADRGFNPSKRSLDSPQHPPMPKRLRDGLGPDKSSLRTSQSPRSPASTPIDVSPRDQSHAQPSGALPQPRDDRQASGLAVDPRKSVSFSDEAGPKNGVGKPVPEPRARPTIQAANSNNYAANQKAPTPIMTSTLDNQMALHSDTGSGNTTPAPVAVMTYPTTNRPAEDIIGRFSKSLFRIAAIAIRLEDARQYYTNSRHDLEKSKPAYESFPALLEQKENIVTTAKRRMDDRKLEMQAHESKHRLVETELAQLVQSGLTASRVGPCTQCEQLEKKFKADMSALEERMMKKMAASATVQNEVQALKKEVAEHRKDALALTGLTARKAEVDKQLTRLERNANDDFAISREKIKNLEDRIRDYEDAIDSKASKRSLDAVESVLRAQKEDCDDLKSSGKGYHRDIEDMKTAVSRHTRDITDINNKAQHDIGHLRKSFDDYVASNATKSSPAAPVEDPASSALATRLERLEREAKEVNQHMLFFLEDRNKLKLLSTKLKGVEDKIATFEKNRTLSEEKQIAEPKILRDHITTCEKNLANVEQKMNEITQSRTSSIAFKPGQGAIAEPSETPTDVTRMEKELKAFRADLESQRAEIDNFYTDLQGEIQSVITLVGGVQESITTEILKAQEEALDMRMSDHEQSVQGLLEFQRNMNETNMNQFQSDITKAISARNTPQPANAEGLAELKQQIQQLRTAWSSGHDQMGSEVKIIADHINRTNMQVLDIINGGDLSKKLFSSSEQFHAVSNTAKAAKTSSDTALEQLATMSQALNAKGQALNSLEVRFHNLTTEALYDQIIQHMRTQVPAPKTSLEQEAKIARLSGELNGTKAKLTAIEAEFGRTMSRLTNEFMPTAAQSIGELQSQTKIHDRRLAELAQSAKQVNETDEKLNEMVGVLIEVKSRIDSLAKKDEDIIDRTAEVESIVKTINDALPDEARVPREAAPFLASQDAQ